jgi:hypothetical protein
MVNWVVDRLRDEQDLPLWNVQFAIKDVTPERIRTLSKAQRLSLPPCSMQNEKLQTRSPLIHSFIKTEKNASFTKQICFRILKINYRDI